MTRITLGAIAALLALAAGTAGAENPKPGLWSQQASLSADGQHWKALPARRDCLSPVQAQRSIEEQIQLMVSQATQAGCRAVEMKAGGGTARGRFSCEQPGPPAQVDVEGSYTADRYTMTMVGLNLADRNGSGVVIPRLMMKHEGRHVGACTS